MRKVKFKKWIPTTYKSMGNRCTQIKNEGTGKWDDDFIYEGVFHQWANAYEEFETGAGNYTVALVEIENGQIESVLPMNVKFLN